MALIDILLKMGLVSKSRDIFKAFCIIGMHQYLTITYKRGDIVHVDQKQQWTQDNAVFVEIQTPCTGKIGSKNR